VDFKWLPGRKGNLYYTNEGLLSTLPAVATTLFGILAAWVLKHGSWTDYKKVVVLVTAGIAAMGLGFLWGIQFPVIKRIWTSSFCLVSGGFASILLGVFYLVVDVWQWRRWCRPFLWIGSNALVAYLAVNLVDFKGIAARLVGGDIQQFLDVHLPQGSGGLLVALVALSLPVLLVRFLHQRKIFVRL
jgi:predicted acyltransferase